MVYRFIFIYYLSILNTAKCALFNIIWFSGIFFFSCAVRENGRSKKITLINEQIYIKNIKLIANRKMHVKRRELGVIILKRSSKSMLIIMSLHNNRIFKILQISTMLSYLFHVKADLMKQESPFLLSHYLILLIKEFIKILIKIIKLWTLCAIWHFMYMVNVLKTEDIKTLILHRTVQFNVSLPFLHYYILDLPAYPVEAEYN